jgi:hypothetical protein
MSAAAAEVAKAKEVKEATFGEKGKEVPHAPVREMLRTSLKSTLSRSRTMAVQFGIRLGPGRCRSIGRTVLVNGREPAEWARGVAEHAV